MLKYAGMNGQRFFSTALGRITARGAGAYLRVRRFRSGGQGLVEFTLMFPVLLIMLSGLMEFGFLLNEYLDVLDGAREAARFVSDADPFSLTPTCDTSPQYENPIFYTNAATLAQNTMAPLALDPARDDIIISVFSIGGGASPTVHARFPQDGCLTSTAGQWHLYNNGMHTSSFSNADVVARLKTNAPNTGIVLVEVFFAYDQKFKLPWITAFVPDPIQVRSFTMMPLVAAEPTPTPSP